MKSAALLPPALPLVIFCAAGCALVPEHTRPVVATPAAWKEAPAATAAAESPWLPIAWWRVFQDQELNALEAQVIAENHDLQAALSRVTEARALARVSAADRWPGLNASSEVVQQHNSLNQPGARQMERDTTQYRNGLDLGYEIDLWGRNRQAATAARADAWAVESDFTAVLLTLTADAARHYHDIRALDVEKRAVEATIGLRRDTLALQSSRHQAGLINEADVTRARTELARVEAESHALTRQRARLEHALAVLCGQPVAEFSVVPRADSFVPPSIPMGLPSELLQRRPDIVAAEQRLEASLARIGVAKADLFPRIALTGFAGLASTDLSTLGHDDSRTWSFGPSVHLPLFDGGRNRANVNAAEARYEQSVAAYRGVVVNAFREVEDAFSDVRSLALQLEATRQALAAARDTAALADERYQRGLSPYFDVVDAQRGVLQSEREEAQLVGQQAAASVYLAKALGGGWTQSEPLAAISKETGGARF